MVATTPSPFVLTAFLGILAVLVGLALLGLPGLLLLVLGLRGKRIDKHPRCRGCGYDLSGHDGTPATCPECGCELGKARRSVRIGNRRRRPIMTSLGALLLLVSLCSVGTIMWARSSQIKLIEHYPVWLLQMELESKDTGTADAAIAELLRRHLAGDLDQNDTIATIDRLLPLHADPASHWSDEHSRFVETAWRNGVLSDERMTTYVRAAIDQSLSIESRSQMRAGAQIPIRLVTGNKRLSSEFGQSNLRNQRSESFVLQSGLGEIRHGDRSVRSPGRSYSTSTVNPGYGATGRTFEIDAGPGSYDLTVAAELKLFLLDKDTGSDDPGREVAAWQVEKMIPLRVLPADQQFIGLIPDDDPQVAATIRNAVLIELISGTVIVDDSHTTSYDEGRGFVAVHRPPVNVAFSVFGRQGDVETSLGSVAIKAGEPANGGWLSQRISDIYPDAESIDIILRADRAVAERTMGIDEIWGGELIFEDQLLRAPSGASQDNQ